MSVWSDFALLRRLAVNRAHVSVTVYERARMQGRAEVLTCEMLFLNDSTGSHYSAKIPRSVLPRAIKKSLSVKDPSVWLLIASDFLLINSMLFPHIASLIRSEAKSGRTSRTVFPRVSESLLYSSCPG